MDNIPVRLCHMSTPPLLSYKEINRILKDQIKHCNDRPQNDGNRNNSNRLLQQELLIRPCNLSEFRLHAAKKLRSGRLVAFASFEGLFILSSHSAAQTPDRSGSYAAHVPEGNRQKAALPPEIILFPCVPCASCRICSTSWSPSVRMRLLILRRVVVALLALRTCQCDSCTHVHPPPPE